MKSIVILFVTCNLIFAFSFKRENEVKTGGLNLTDTKDSIELKPRRTKEIQNAESMFPAESNYVYRPLFVYRRIEHSKRRITMYNSFAG